MSDYKGVYEEYYRLIYEVVRIKRYYELSKYKIGIFNLIVSMVTAVVSIAGAILIVFTFAPIPPIIPVIMVVISQIFTTLLPFLKFTKLYTEFEIGITKLEHLRIDMFDGYFRYRAEDINDKQLTKMLKEYSKQFDNIKEECGKNSFWPKFKKDEKEAELYANKYIKNKLNGEVKYVEDAEKNT